MSHEKILGFLQGTNPFRLAFTQNQWSARVVRHFDIYTEYELEKIPSDKLENYGLAVIAGQGCVGAALVGFGLPMVLYHFQETRLYSVPMAFLGLAYFASNFCLSLLDVSSKTDVTAYLGQRYNTLTANRHNRWANRQKRRGRCQKHNSQPDVPNGYGDVDLAKWPIVNVADPLSQTDLPDCRTRTRKA